MFSIDPRLMSRIEPVIRRAMVVDPHAASARLLADLMKGMGSREVILESDEKRALEIARDFDPGILFVEASGPRLDGEALARRLRRSHLFCRKAPIVMVTADATASTIKGARDAGVHEFLRKPFTAGDLLKRIEAVSLKPRDWIEAVGYVGPDRRRFNSAEFSGEQKRKNDKPATRTEAQAQATDQALRILKAAHGQFDSDPAQALRAMKEQAASLKAAAVKAGEARLAVAVAGLDLALSNPQATRVSLSGPVEKVLGLFPDLAAPALAKAG